MNKCVTGTNEDNIPIKNRKACYGYTSKQRFSTVALKSLEEYHNRYLAERIVPLIMSAEYYNAYLKGFVVPHFEESMFSIFEDYRLYHELEGYNREIPPIISVMVSFCRASLITLLQHKAHLEDDFSFMVPSHY